MTLEHGVESLCSDETFCKPDMDVGCCQGLILPAVISALCQKLDLAPGEKAEKAGARAIWKAGSLGLQFVTALPKTDDLSTNHNSYWYLLTGCPS